MSSPAPSTPDIPASRSRSPRRTSTPGRAADRTLSYAETCGVCGEPLTPTPAEHLRTHALTPATYARVFRATLAPGAPHPEAVDIIRARSSADADAPSLSGVPHRLLATIADACALSDDFRARLATDVQAHILGGSTRGLLAASLGALIATRAKQAGEAASRLSAINAEMSMPWRIEHGGENGAPTPTRELVSMQMASATELDRATDAIIRAAKVAVDERRGMTGEAPGDAPLDRYSGALDALALPADVGPGERAIMMAIMERMAGRVLRSRTVIDATTIPPLADRLPPGHPDEGGIPDGRGSPPNPDGGGQGAAVAPPSPQGAPSLPGEAPTVRTFIPPPDE